MRYVIVPIEEINSVDYSEVLQTSADTVTKNVESTQFIVKFEGDMPASVSSLQGISQAYTHKEILDILSAPEWTPEEE